MTIKRFVKFRVYFANLYVHFTLSSAEALVILLMDHYFGIEGGGVSFL